MRGFYKSCHSHSDRFTPVADDLLLAINCFYQDHVFESRILFVFHDCQIVEAQCYPDGCRPSGG